MKRIIISLVLLPFLTSVYSQQVISKKEITLPTNFQERLEFSGAYFGNMFWNPGIKFGTEYLWKEKEKLKKNGTNTIVKQKILSGDVGLYWDPLSHVGVFNYYGIIFRRTNLKKNRQANFKFHPIGIYRSFLPETYEVKGNDVGKVTLPGRFYYAPSFSFGTGKLRAEKRLKAYFINLNFMFLIQYNNAFNPLISLDFGYRFNGKRRNQLKNDEKMSSPFFK